ncbi:MAG: methylated-DNA--[protein]-cysteine S-methyltransferase [Chlorobiaceae bacterium]|nr:methylated-DNA--[protein]-cysteine S-methyltransferase [Chlorobiaceae bacterium]
MIISFQLTAIGKVGIAECGGFITNLFFATDSVPQEAEIGDTELHREAFRQLNAYLQKEQRAFTLPLAPSGTPFMQRVWQNLLTIPYGSTATYREIAGVSGNPLGARAVGMASHRNPVPVFIPCHRVVGSDGSLTGYRGGLGLKKELLELEKGSADKCLENTGRIRAKD